MINRNAALIAFAVLFVFACNNNPKSNLPEIKEATIEDTPVVAGFPEELPIDSMKETAMLPTMDEAIPTGKNVIYTSAFMYAWDEVGKLLKGPLVSKEADTTQLSHIARFKNYINTLKQGEYTAIARYEDDAIIAEAKFNKQVPFYKELQECEGLTFKGKKVKTFGINHYDMHDAESVDIIYYKNDGEFVVRLRDKEGEHSVYLYMSPSFGNTQANIFAAMQKLIKQGAAERKSGKENWRYTLNKQDLLFVPEFSFNLSTHYNKIEGHKFYCNDGLHTMVKAIQRTAFVLNAKGAAIESEAYVVADSVAIPIAPPQPKRMLFNKPFAIFMQRSDAKHPYLALMVNNAELMVPSK